MSKQLINRFKTELMSDAKAQSRVRAVNKLLEVQHEDIWESLFFAVWYAEMGHGCEDIISSIVRVCHSNYKLAETGIKELAAKWHGLDQYRIDKISHLSRHLLNVIVEQQIRVRLTAKEVMCKKLILSVLTDIQKATGLCIFVLEAFVTEFRRALTKVYAEKGLAFGHDKLKSKLIAFVYQQFVVFAARQGNDTRFMKTLDRSIFRSLIVDHLSHESQTTQLMVTMRLRDSFRQHASKTAGKLTLNRRLRIRFEHWQDLMDRTHESCIAGEHFVVSLLPKPVEINIHRSDRDKKKLKKQKKTKTNKQQ